jgi:hypothetical protein
MDVAFIVDNTSSTENSILTQLRAGVATILDEIQTSSGNNYRLALVTPCKDEPPASPDLVDVRVPFVQNNRTDFQAKLNTL